MQRYVLFDAFERPIKGLVFRNKQLAEEKAKLLGLKVRLVCLP